MDPKTAEQQAQADVFRRRQSLLTQRTQSTIALRGHLYGFGHIAPEGIGYVPRLGHARSGIFSLPARAIPRLFAAYRAVIRTASNALPYSRIQTCIGLAPRLHQI